MVNTHECMPMHYIFTMQFLFPQNTCVTRQTETTVMNIVSACRSIINRKCSLFEYVSAYESSCAILVDSKVYILIGKVVCCSVLCNFYGFWPIYTIQ